MKFGFALYFQIPNVKVSLEWKLFNPVVAINIFKLFYGEAERARRYIKNSNICAKIFKPISFSAQLGTVNFSDSTAGRDHWDHGS